MVYYTPRCRTPYVHQILRYSNTTPYDTAVSIEVFREGVRASLNEKEKKTCMAKK